MLKSVRGPFVAAVLFCAWSLPAPSQAAGDIRLDFIGQSRFPTGYTFDNTEVGGLSGIDYDRRTHGYVAISDDRGQHGFVRFYRLDIDLADGYLNAGDVRFTDVTAMRDAKGRAFAPGGVDPESIRVASFPGLLYWASEGDASQNIAPSVRVMTPAGRQIAAFDIPRTFRPRGDRGIRNNLAFESLTYDRATNTWFTAVENALSQDGPIASRTRGSPVRVLALDAATGKPRREYVYETDPIPAAPVPAGGGANNGLSELLAYGPGRFIALERAYSAGVGNDIKLFSTTTRGASRVQWLPSIRRTRIRPMRKSLLLDLARAGISPDNIEGMTFGPRIDGDRTLILVSDNNFSASQTTQFLAFRIRRSNRSRRGR